MLSDHIVYIIMSRLSRYMIVLTFIKLKTKVQAIIPCGFNARSCVLACVRCSRWLNPADNEGPLTKWADPVTSYFDIYFFICQNIM